MRSFLRGSLYGVTASTGWINPQQQQHPTAQMTPAVPMNAAPNAVRGAHAMVQPAVMQPLQFTTRHNYGGFVRPKDVTVGDFPAEEF